MSEAGGDKEAIRPEILPGTDAGYAGDVTAAEAWRVLAENRKALLIDVRTRAEWAFVGLTDLAHLGKQPILIEWVTQPDMARNPDFESHAAEAIAEAGGDTAVFFLCRSGARSKAAAIAMTERGFSPCYNIENGFEGDLDEGRHRGRRNGWKVAGLPWVQS